jgi:hypothetical protein
MGGRVSRLVICIKRFQIRSLVNDLVVEYCPGQDRFDIDVARRRVGGSFQSGGTQALCERRLGQPSIALVKSGKIGVILINNIFFKAF